MARLCLGCGDDISLRDARSSFCKTCQNILNKLSRKVRDKQRYEDNPEKMRAIWREKWHRNKKIKLKIHPSCIINRSV